MNQKQYLQEVIAHYLDAPDTPNKARKTDWAIATTFYHQGIPLDHIAHALRLSAPDHFVELIPEQVGS